MLVISNYIASIQYIEHFFIFSYQIVLLIPSWLIVQYYCMNMDHFHCPDIAQLRQVCGPAYCVWQKAGCSL